MRHTHGSSASDAYRAGPIRLKGTQTGRAKEKRQQRDAGRKMAKNDVWVRVGAYRLCEAVCEVDTPYDIKTRIIFFIVGETETHEDV